jgi:SAM-dependent methyltransferase
MKYVVIFLAVMLLLDALQLRSRLVRLKSLSPRKPGGPKERAGLFLVREGVRLDVETRGEVEALAAAENLGLIDLVPRELPALSIIDLARLFAPDRYRTDALAPGCTARHAAFVDADVASRAGIEETTFRDARTFIQTIERLKKYSPTGDLVVAPRLPAIPEPSRARLAVLEATQGLLMMRMLLSGKLLVMVLLALGIVLPGARVWGAVALAMFHLHPLLVVLGTPFRPRDLASVVLFRFPIELFRWLIMMFGKQGGGEPDPWAEARPIYARLLSEGPAPFFEPRRDTCPLCESPELTVHLRSGERLQLKPGRFTLERCRRCGHIFQNPALSVEGLSWYYRDFYDGLFGPTVSSHLSTTKLHRERARMVRGILEPRRWLDVGAAEAEFCLIARKEWPETRFDVLDLDERVEEAVRCRRAEQAYVGWFPALAPSFEGEYDVVSMSHYLEHAPVPKDEIAAARRALKPGGCLFIEVPDPASLFGRVLGRWWFPWYQPQHLHFLSAQNLDALLQRQGFTAVRWHRHEAHIPGDLAASVIMVLNRLGPVWNLPWRPPGSPLARLRCALVWAAGLAPLVIASFGDAALLPFVRPLGLSTAYRVVARRNETEPSPSRV